MYLSRSRHLSPTFCHRHLRECLRASIASEWLVGYDPPELIKTGVLGQIDHFPPTTLGHNTLTHGWEMHENIEGGLCENDEDCAKKMDYLKLVNINIIADQQKSHKFCIFFAKMLSRILSIWFEVGSGFLVWYNFCPTFVRLSPNTAYRVRIRFVGDLSAHSVWSAESEWLRTMVLEKDFLKIKKFRRPHQRMRQQRCMFCPSMRTHCECSGNRLHGMHGMRIGYANSLRP